MDFRNSSRRDLLAQGTLLGIAGVALAAREGRAEPAEDGSKTPDHPQHAYSRNVEIILAFCKAGQARDVEAQMAFIPDDGTYHNMPDDPIVGKANIRALLTGYLTGSDATEIQVHAIAEARPGLVLTERLDRFRSKGKWIDCPVMGAAEIENGKIKHWRDYYDNLRLSKQMG
jgi:limonene-1,2-epoxide hydrolase